MKVEYTPGPWEADGRGFITYTHPDFGRCELAQVFHAPYVSVQGARCMGKLRPNAQLIAAAPELARAAVLVAELWANEDPTTAQYERAHQAVLDALTDAGIDYDKEIFKCPT